MSGETQTFECRDKKFTARRHPETGMVYLCAEKGELPPALSGAFNDFSEAKSMLNCYYWPHGKMR